MSEYSFVEKPFLDQLAALDWTVIDQGAGIPTDPTKSLRTSFREVTLRDEFNRAVRAINQTDDGRQWLTDNYRIEFWRGHVSPVIERRGATFRQ